MSPDNKKNERDSPEGVKRRADGVERHTGQWFLRWGSIPHAPQDD